MAPLRNFDGRDGAIRAGAAAIQYNILGKAFMGL